MDTAVSAHIMERFFGELAGSDESGRQLEALLRSQYAGGQRWDVPSLLRAYDRLSYGEEQRAAPDSR